MQLSSNATSQTELLEDIVTLILHRAKQEGSLAVTTKAGTRFNWQCEYAAGVLAKIAVELKNMELAGGNMRENQPAGFEIETNETPDENGNTFTRV